MAAAIEVSGLRNRFGKAQALDGMTFTVAPGQVTGFVGPNGAGKSTTMRVMAPFSGYFPLSAAAGLGVLLAWTAAALALAVFLLRRRDA